MKDNTNCGVCYRITKCDFCVMLKPDGSCYWSTQLARIGDCKKAIKLMSETIGNKSVKEK